MSRASVWVLRALLAGTAAGLFARGLALHGALGVALLVGLLAAERFRPAAMPQELELALLLVVDGDLALGRLGQLYTQSSWFDKALHLSSSASVGLVVLLLLTAMRAAGQLRAPPGVTAALVVLLTLGAGALWEIVEYATDLALQRRSQGNRVMSPLDDTMWDLIFDGLGGLLGWAVGVLYLRLSRHARERIDAFRRLGTRGER